MDQQSVQGGTPSATEVVLAEALSQARLQLELVIDGIRGGQAGLESLATISRRLTAANNTGCNNSGCGGGGGGSGCGAADISQPSLQKG